MQLQNPPNKNRVRKIASENKDIANKTKKKHIIFGENIYYFKSECNLETVNINKTKNMPSIDTDTATTTTTTTATTPTTTSSSISDFGHRPGDPFECSAVSFNNEYF